jgi:hypothetical protein
MAEPMVLVVTDRDSVGAALVGDLICSSFCQVGHGWAGRLAGCRRPALFPCCWVFPVWRVERRTVKPDIRGLVTAGRVVRLEWASLSTEGERGQPGLVVHRSRVDPVPRAGPGFNLPARTLLMILFVGRLLQIVGGVLRRGPRAGR